LRNRDETYSCAISTQVPEHGRRLSRFRSLRCRIRIIIVTSVMYCSVPRSAVLSLSLSVRVCKSTCVCALESQVSVFSGWLGRSFDKQNFSSTNAIV
jgi:hypothetical protein